MKAIWNQNNWIQIRRTSIHSKKKFNKLQNREIKNREMQKNGEWEIRYMESRGDWKGQDGVYGGEVVTTTSLQTTPFWGIFERLLGIGSVCCQNSKKDKGGRG